MLVSNGGENWRPRIVIFQHSDNSCEVVDLKYEEGFLRGDYFGRLIYYDLCKPIPEPSTEIWTWQKAVVWCNKQENIVTYLDGLRGVSSGFGPRSLCDMEDVIWNKLNDDGTYKYDKWRKFNDRDCLDE